MVELTVVVVPSTCNVPLITTVVSSSPSPMYVVSEPVNVASAAATFVLSVTSADASIAFNFV